MERQVVQDIYAVASSNIDEVAQMLTSSGLSLERHDSLYLGGDYYRARLDECEIVLRQNVDLLESLHRDDKRRRRKNLRARTRRAL